MRGVGESRIGRPREFDDERVLGDAMGVFWRRGFRGATVEALVERTGVSPQSLYGAFGSKRALFLRTLERYRKAGLAATREALDGGNTPAEGIRSYLEAQVVLACDGPLRRGCLMANTALELLPGDSEVDALVARNFAGLQRALGDAVARAQTVGEIRKPPSARLVAWQLLALVEGIYVLGRTIAADELTELVNTSLADLAPSQPQI